jgi:flagellar basal body-associated protein FliL
MSTNINSSTPAKKLKTSWAVIILLTIAAVLGGVVYFYSISNELQDDMYSVSFTSPVHIEKVVKKPATKTPAKPVVKATTVK